MIWSCNFKELYAVFPEWKKMNRVLLIIQSQCTDFLISCLYIFHVNCQMVLSTCLHRCLMIFIDFQHQISKL